MRLAPPVEQMIFEKIQPETKEERANTFKHLFEGGYFLYYDSEQRVDRSNQEVSFSVLLRRNSSQVIALSKHDVRIQVSVAGKYHVNDQFAVPFRGPTLHTRTLSCPRDSYFCKPIVVFRQRYIMYPYYRISFRFLNLDELYNSGFLDDVLFTKFEFTNREYTTFETSLRLVFLFASMVIFVFYMVSLFWSQEWKFCKTEQKWIALLLSVLILFNNPFFIADWSASHWFFPTLEILFQSTFAFVFLLFIMVMTHSALVHPSNRGILFYLPKIILVSILWILITAVLCWERFGELNDPSMDIAEMNYFYLLKIAIAVLGTIIVCQIGFHTVKAIVGDDIIRTVHNAFDNGDTALNMKTSGDRFKVLFFLNILVLLIIAVDYASFLLFDYANNAAQYLSLFPLVNYYAILLAIFFLPSNQPDFSGHAIIEPEIFKLVHDEDKKRTAQLE
jgi:hypothetical protein